MSTQDTVNRRRSIRLPAYDYRTAGAYFVTIVTHHWRSCFGEIVRDEMRPNKFGEVVTEEWLRTGEVRCDVILDEFIVMPNHVHGLICLGADAGAQRAAPLHPVRGMTSGVPPNSLGAIVRAFKAASTKRVNELRRAPGEPLWQRNYYERVIRVDQELERAREYIRYNPLRWAEDKHNPGRAVMDNRQEAAR